MVTDIGEKTAAVEKEMIERRRIFDTSLDLILVTDRKGRFRPGQPERARTILGFEPDEMVGRSAVEFLYAEDLDATPAQHMQAVAPRPRHGHASRRDTSTATATWSLSPGQVCGRTSRSSTSSSAAT